MNQMEIMKLLKLFFEIIDLNGNYFQVFENSIYCGLALLFCRFLTPNFEGCMNPYNFCSTGCPFLVSFI